MISDLSVRNKIIGKAKDKTDYLEKSEIYETIVIRTILRKPEILPPNDLKSTQV